MAGFFTNVKRWIQTRDFWDESGNNRQRDQWAREDEEERKKRNLQAVRTPDPKPTTPSFGQQQQTPLFDPANPLKKVGSQSQFGMGVNSTDPLMLNTKPKNTLDVIKETKPKTPEQIASEKKTKDLDDLAADNYEKARKDSEQGESWLGRNILNRKAIDERAKTLARSRATTQYQEKHGWNADKDVLAYGKETSRMAGEESDRLRREGEKLDDFGRKLNKAGEIASYIPVTGSVLNLGLAGTEKLAKATGNEAYGRDIEDQRLAIDLGMTREEFDGLDHDMQQKLRNLQTLGLALSPLDFLGVGGLAKSGVVSAGKKGFQEAIEGGLKAGTKNAIKKAGVQAAKEAGIPAAIGAGASVGAQTYLGGTENIDPIEAAKTGLLVGGTSLLFPSQGIRNAADETVDDAARRAVKNSLDEVDDAARGIDEAGEAINDASSLTKATQEEGAPRKVTTSAGEAAVEIESGIKSTNVPKAATTPSTVPDVTNPIALAKASQTAGAVAEDVPMANFQNSVDGSQPLQKAPSTMPEQQQLNLEATPQKAVVGQAARTEVSNPASLREREAFAATEQDPVLAQEIIDSIPSKTPMNVEESLSIARNNARSQTPEQLVASWGEGRAIDQNNPQAWVNALEERKVLNALVSEGVPGAREARLNLADAMSGFQSRSGQNLNILKVAYDEMPSDMKAELLIKKVNRARNKAGLDDLNDADMEMLLSRVEVAEQANLRLKAIEDEIGDFNRAITSGSATPEARARLEGLNKAKDEALTDLYQKNAGVTDYFGKLSPDSTFGQKLANWNRISMLSSFTGRIFDLASTGATAGLDTVNRALSSIFARGLNGRMGDGGALETLPQALPGKADIGDAWTRTKNSAQGVNEVRDVMAEIQGMGTGRSEMNSQSNGRFRNAVKAATEAPTELTRYIENNEIYRRGRQAADELGLKGDDADLYADSYWSVASSNEKYAAQQEHLKANMLYNNAVSSKIDQVSNTLLRSESSIGKSTGAILKSVVAPFTRFIGGMTHRTFTDMNVVHNVWEMRKAIKNGDTQLLADSLAKATTNMGIGLATATVLAESGVLTDKDANGDSYAGLYFHVGDRYIPVGFAGLASVPMIVGYGVNQAFNSDNATDAFTDVTTDTLSRVLASTGTAGFFGADNALQTAIGGASSAISPSESGANERDFADVLGSTVRQSIPGIGNDANAILNQIPGINPTGEAADTKVLNEDGTQNPLGTQIAKTQNTIPGLSQLLPRKEGTPARDVLDRITKGNHETGEMADKRGVKEQLSESKKALEKEGIPTTAEKIADLGKSGDFDKAVRGAEYRLAELEADEKATENSKKNARQDLENYQFGKEYGYIPSSDESVQARAERGEYDAAIAGWQLRLSRDEADGDTPDSKLQTQRRKIQRYEVFRDNNINPGMVDAYEKDSAENGGVGVTAWREMMDSGDPKLVAYAEQLYNLDKALLDAGAVREAKYYWKGGRGGSGGGRGGSGSARFVTDIATQNAKNFTFSPIKAEKASFSAPQSAIPKLEKVKNNDTSKLKKISVKRGGRA